MPETPPVDLDVLRRLDSTQVDHTNQGDSFLRVRSDVNVIASAAADEIERLRSAISDAVTELDAEHRPDGHLCAMCGAADGSWPCVSRMVADDLRVLLDSKDQPHEA